MLFEKRHFIFLVAWFFVLFSDSYALPHQSAVLQTLDKVTARVSTVKLNVGDLLNLGPLQIIAKHCDKRPPEEPPETVAFLDIWENRVGQLPSSIFRGWMFAASPGLNALEHPVYDIWLLDCIGPIEKKGN